MADVRMSRKEAISWLKQPGIQAMMPVDPHTRKALNVILAPIYSKEESPTYKEYDKECRQLGLSEKFTTKSKSTYEWMLNILATRKGRGYGDDYRGYFEIRFR